MKIFLLCKLCKNYLYVYVQYGESTERRTFLNLTSYICTNFLFKDNPVDPVVVPYVLNNANWLDI